MIYNLTMKKTSLICVATLFLVSCQEVKIYKKTKINPEYRVNLFENPSIKKVIQDVASNFGRIEASVVIDSNIIIVRTSKGRMRKVDSFFSEFETPDKGK